jgi:RHS repeat-associated protein
MTMPGRKFSQSNNKYRYGFGGQEKSDEIKGEGNSYTAEYWEYDPRLGRRWNVDPITKPHESPYAAFSNNPITNIDPLGNSDSTVTSPNGGSFTLPESAKITKNSFAYTNAAGVKFQHSDGAVESFTWQDKEYTARYNSKTGEFTGYKAQLDAAHGNQMLPFSYGKMDWLIERVMANSSSGPMNQLEEYRARRAYGGYLPGETQFDRFCRNCNNSHIEEMMDFGGGGYNMWGGYGKIANSSKFINLASSERTAHIIAGDATGGGHAWFGSWKGFTNGLTGQKSMFPVTWSNGKIMNAASDVLVNNPIARQTGPAGSLFENSGRLARFTTFGEYQGIKLKVVWNNADIITAHPIK